MNGSGARAEYFLEVMRKGDREAAFFGLLESEDDVIPFPVEAFLNEPNAILRAELIHVLWEKRKPAVIPFLGQALQDPDSKVWREALNGLVRLASTQSLELLETAFPCPSYTERQRADFQQWISEAIDQVGRELQNAH